ncbi:hypothetical protein [Gottfriedia luciferensis]|uniref:hypothetical protein n=1 Tax=Gottfriedia luciferensis TaxID=178774 RepID=UPI000B44297F|nr:hypothetical protein [Gottfriedia luciferensis]
MKRYFSWEDDYIRGTTYIEIEDGFAIKQIAVTQNRYIASNRKDEEHHYYLAEGKIEVFYPQGVIVSISENVIGVADYIKCKDNSQPENLYPHHKITGKVNGYDEINMWLILENAKVF